MRCMHEDLSLDHKHPYKMLGIVIFVVPAMVGRYRKISGDHQPDRLSQSLGLKNNVKNEG